MKGAAPLRRPAAGDSGPPEPASGGGVRRRPASREPAGGSVRGRPAASALTVMKGALPGAKRRASALAAMKGASPGAERRARARVRSPEAQPPAAPAWYYAPWDLGPYDAQLPTKGEAFEAIVIDSAGERRGSALLRCTSGHHALPQNGVAVEAVLLGVEDDAVRPWARGFFEAKPSGVHFCQVAAPSCTAHAAFRVLHVDCWRRRSVADATEPWVAAAFGASARLGADRSAGAVLAGRSDPLG